jgi:excisionase family DNA binding protein
MGGVFSPALPSKLDNMSDDGREKDSPGALIRVEEPLGLAIRGARIGTLDPAVLSLLQSLVSNAVASQAVSSQKVPVERRIFLTMAESAELSGLSAGFLRSLIRDGRLKAIRAGSRWRIPRAELESLADKLTTAPLPAQRTQQLSEAEERDLEMNRLRRQGLLPESIDIQEIN